MLGGCALSFNRETTNDGFDFPSANVSRIVRNKTTADELVQLFGGPLEKTELPDNSEEWKYYYSTGYELKEQGFLTDYEKSEHHSRTLYLQLTNGVVKDYTYREGH